MAQKMTLQEFLQKLVSYHNLLEEREASYGSLAAPIHLIQQIEQYEYAIGLTEEALMQNTNYETLQHDLAHLNLDFSTEITVKVERKPFDGRNPYRGLEKFTESDAEFFFGRTAATAELVSMTRQLINGVTGPQNPALLTVVGASGNGKSSLVRAGLIPKFYQGIIKDSEHWPIKVMVPGHSPLDALSSQFKGLLGRGAPLIRTELDSSSKAFHLLLCEALSDQPNNLYYILVIDQLEELFTLCESEQERRDFIDLILYEAYQRDHRSLIIVTMRADFYSRALDYKDLAEAITVHQFAVSPMTGRELREAILLPAEIVGLEMERDLALALVQDTAKEPGRLPLLQHAMLELFNRRSQDNVMTLADYNEIGGVQGALTHRADEVLKQLTPEQQHLARHIFIELTELGEGVSDTRRRVSRSRLDDLGDPTQIEAVLNKLSGQEARLVVSGAEVEVTHEALIQQWGQLRDWLDEDRESIRLHRRLSAAAQDWQAHNQDTAYLHTGSLLIQAEVWAETTTDLSPNERAFLDASLEQRDRVAHEKEVQRQRELEQQRQLAEEQRQRAEDQEQAATRQRKLTRIAFGIGAMAIIAAFVAGFFGWLSNENAAEAEVQKIEAVSAKGTAVANEEEAKRQEAEAKQNLDLAQTREAEAVEAREDAKTEAERASAEATRANKETERAERQANIALSRQLAAESLNVLDTNPERAILLAMEAITTTTIMEYPVLPEAINALNRAAQSFQIQKVINAHSNIAFDVSYSLDGKYLASGGFDGIVNIWDLETDTPPIVLPRDGSPLTSAKINRNGTYVYLTDLTGNVEIWDLATRQLLPGYPISMHKGAAIIDADLTMDGLLLATTGEDKATQIINSTTSEIIQQIPLDSIGCGVAFNTNGSQVAIGDLNGNIYVWDIELAKETRRFTHASKYEEACAVAFSPDNKILASGGADRTTKLWSLETGDLLATLALHTDTIWRIVFSPDGKLLASAGFDNKANIYDISSGKLLQTLAGHTGRLRAVAFAPDGGQLATSDEAGEIRLWDVSFGYHSGIISRVLFSPDGDFFASAGADGSIKVWESQSEKLLQQIDIGGWVWDIDIHPTQSLIAAVSNNNMVQIWNIATNKQVSKFSVNTASAGSIAYSPDGQLLAVAGDEGVLLWDTLSQNQVNFFSTPQQNYNVAFSPDGKNLAVVTADRMVRVWDLITDELKFTLIHEPNWEIFRVAFGPNDNLLATAGADGKVKLWDATTGEFIAEITGHTNSVYDAKFSPDGKLLVTASAEPTVKVWDLSPVAETSIITDSILEFKDFSQNVLSVNFSPDGREVVAAGADQVIRRYRLSLTDLIEEIEQRLIKLKKK